jgi:UDP-glucose-4-epimerase GalE
MRVLVTGGAGYIGSHTARLLAERGIETVVYDNLSRGYRWAVEWCPLVVGDLADRELLRETLEKHRIDAVVHFAAFALVSESIEKPGEYFRNNTANSLTLLESMREAGVSTIVFSSTCAVYGDPVRLPLSEDHPQNPVSPYGESKLMTERALHWYGRCHGFRWAALRYFNACGAHPDARLGEVHNPETHLVPNILRAALGRLPHLEVYGNDYPTPDGTAIRDYIHVLDLAEAHLRALEHLSGPGGTPGASGVFNLGTGTGHTVREMIRVAERVSGRAIPVRDCPRRPGDPPELVARASRAAEILGWTPRCSDLETIVETAWRWETSEARARAGV